VRVWGTSRLHSARSFVTAVTACALIASGLAVGLTIGIARPAFASSLANGAVSTLAGSGSSTSAAGSATTAGFAYPTSATVSGGYAYVGGHDALMKVSLSDGTTTLLAGEPGTCSESNGSDGATTSFCWITSTTTDGTYVYTIDAYGYVRKTSIATGATTTLTTVGNPAPGLIYVSGELYAATNPSGTGQILQIDPSSGSSSTYYTFPSGESLSSVTYDDSDLWAVSGSGGNGYVDKITMGGSPAMTHVGSDRRFSARARRSGCVRNFV
jgi:hypothetical protein